MKRVLALSLLLLAACLVAALAQQEGAAADPTSAAQTMGASARVIPNPSTTAHALDKSDLESWFDGFLPYAIESGDIAGGVIVVVKDGELLFTKGYGYADVAAHSPVDPERTMFRPGSVSKLFTWTAVMQMVEQGKLDLDRNVNDYLDFHIPDRADGPITLRNIMTHTAGFEEQIKSIITVDPKNLRPLAEYARNATPTRIFKAGSTPAYSNYATTLAGYLVQRVSGQSFDDYVENHIFKPLGMTHATFRQPLPAQFSPDMAKGYRVASEPAKPYELVVPAPAGSLAASGVDMGKFMIAHLQDGEFQGQRILQAKTAEQMHTSATTMIPPLNRMMLGFYEQNYDGHRVISHGGDTEWMHSYLHLFPDDHVGLFMAFNSQGREGAVGKVRQAVFDKFVDRYFPGPWPGGSVAKDVAQQHARMMAGYYDDSRRADTSFMSLGGFLSPVKVAVARDGSLTMSLMMGRNGVLQHFKEIAPFVWRDTSSGWRMAANVADGHVKRFSVDEISPFMVFDPTPGYRSPAWLRPGVAIAFGACFLTALLWPIAAISRRRHRVQLPLAGVALRGHRVSRIAAAVLSGMTLVWFVFLIGATKDIATLTSSLDPLLILLYLLSVVAYVGGTAAMIWSAWIAWSTPRPVAARIWVAVLALSAVVLLYFAQLYHLMSFVTKY
ncbi:MAG: serine hydrolase domain-containing protein [Steroidobacteraceae bacterium]